MSKQRVSVSRLIAFRYISIKSHSHLVSFMSSISIFGLSLGVGILITALSIMNGFDKEMRENILGVIRHISVSTEKDLNSLEWQNIEDLVLDLATVEAISPTINVGGVAASPDGSSGGLVNGGDPDREIDVSVIDDFYRR